MITEVFFDTETQKLFSEIESDNPGDLKLSIVSIYSRTLDDNLNEIEGTLQSFWEDDLDNFWPLLQKAERLIGYNSKKFDTAVLQPYAPFPLAKLNHFDIMEKVKEIIGNRLPLDAIAKETLGRQKTADGLAAVEFWLKHDKESLIKLQKYCEEDVLITKEIYDHVLKNRSLKYLDKWNTKRTIDIDFSYPNLPDSKQVGLF